METKREYEYGVVEAAVAARFAGAGSAVLSHSVFRSRCMCVCVCRDAMVVVCALVQNVMYKINKRDGNLLSLQYMKV